MCSGGTSQHVALQTAWDLTTSAFNWPFQVGARVAEDVMEQLKVYGKRMHQVMIEQAGRGPNCAAWARPSPASCSSAPMRSSAMSAIRLI